MTGLSETQMVALAVLAAQVGILAAAATFTAPSADLDLAVEAMRDPLDSNRVTELVVELANQDPEPVEPRFTVLGAALSNRLTWTIEEGPSRLEPGEEAVYRITQSPYTGIPLDEPYRVAANDVDETDRRVVTSVRTAQVPGHRAAAANPGFHAWEASMIADHALPFGWIPTRTLHGNDEARIAGGDGVLDLHLEPDMSRGPSSAADAWSMVGVRQRIDFPSELRVVFEGGDRSAFAGGPRVMVGVVVEDPYARNQVVVLFTEPPTDPEQESTRFLEADGYQSERILVTGRETTLNLTEIWRGNGWRIPALQWVDPERPHGPADAGTAGLGIESLSVYGRYARPVEMKVLLASFPPHEEDELDASFRYAGGPVLGAVQG